MFKISRKMEYALIALKHMCKKAPGQLTSAKEICDTYHTPFDPTSRVLQIMAQYEILRAEQGAHGGYQILKDLSKVSLGDLNEIIIGPMKIVNCINGDYSRCELTASCNVIGPLVNLNQKINSLFHTLSVLGLIECKNPVKKAPRVKQASAA